MPDTSSDSIRDTVDARWVTCLELAWESFLAGGVPVGSVLSNGSGHVVAEGRNRFRDLRSSEAGTQQISGTHVAHAEMNVLVQLPPGDYSDHILWSSLEPCFMCTSAVLQTHVGQVRFGAADPLMEGISDLPQISPWIQHRWVPREGPASGPVAAVSGALVAAWHHTRGDSDLGRLVSAANGADQLTSAIVSGNGITSLDTALDWLKTHTA